MTFKNKQENKIVIHYLKSISKKIFLKKEIKVKNLTAFKTEQGRSMVEMLGVLAVIGVLTIGGVVGYRMAMNKYTANQITSELNILKEELRIHIINGHSNVYLGEPYERNGEENGHLSKGNYPFAYGCGDGTTQAMDCQLASQYYLEVDAVEKGVCPYLTQLLTYMPDKHTLNVNGKSVDEETASYCDQEENTLLLVLNSEMNQNRKGSSDESDEQCQNDTDCPAELPVCNRFSGQCEGCPAEEHWNGTICESCPDDKPIWNEASKVCINKDCGDNAECNGGTYCFSDKAWSCSYPLPYESKCQKLSTSSNRVTINGMAFVASTQEMDPNSAVRFCSAHDKNLITQEDVTNYLPELKNYFGEEEYWAGGLNESVNLSYGTINYAYRCKLLKALCR